MDEAFLKSAHRNSFQNREEIERSNIAGCFYCKEIFQSKEVDEWIPDNKGDTAECPRCGIDSVIGDASGIQISKEFLKNMHKVWFERTIPFEDLKSKSWFEKVVFLPGIPLNGRAGF